MLKFVMSEKTVKQTAIEYFGEPKLSKAEIQAMQEKLFPVHSRLHYKNLFGFMPRPLFFTLVLFIIILPLIFFGWHNIFPASPVDARDFTANIYQQAQNNIIYLKIYSDNIDEQAFSESWYDSSIGILKTQRENESTAEYSFTNFGQPNTGEPAAAPLYNTKETDASLQSGFPSLPELSSFMRALGASINSGTLIESVQYNDEPAYKIMINETDGHGIINIYFIRNSNTVYIQTPAYTHKVIYSFIKPDLSNQNMIFNNK